MAINEDQNIEWKMSWRDEYLKWICGFANAQGGVLEIGRNDRGEVIGVNLDRPRAAGVIRHVGATKAGRWEVLK